MTAVVGASQSSVPFPHELSSVPVVLVTPRLYNSLDKVFVGTNGTSEKAFLLSVKNDTTADMSVTVDWVAFYE